MSMYPSNFQPSNGVNITDKACPGLRCQRQCDPQPILPLVQMASRNLCIAGKIFHTGQPIVVSHQFVNNILTNIRQAEMSEYWSLVKYPEVVKQKLFSTFRRFLAASMEVVRKSHLFLYPEQNFENVCVCVGGAVIKNKIYVNYLMVRLGKILLFK